MQFHAENEKQNKIVQAGSLIKASNYLVVREQDEECKSLRPTDHKTPAWIQKLLHLAEFNITTLVGYLTTTATKVHF